MPTREDLVGLGTPPGVASLLGNSPQAINGAGTTQATATPILTTLCSITAAGGATGGILPADAKIGTPYYVTSVSGTAAKIWPPVGHYLNGSQNTGVTFSAATASGVFIQMSSKQWFTIPLAP